MGKLLCDSQKLLQYSTSTEENPTVGFDRHTWLGFIATRLHSSATLHLERRGANNRVHQLANVLDLDLHHVARRKVKRWVASDTNTLQKVTQHN